MRTRKTKDIKKALGKKGFVLNPEKDHHNYYYLEVGGKKVISILTLVIMDKIIIHF